MKALILLPLLALPVLNAQETAEMTMEERKASVVQLRSNIEAREQRLEEVVGDIRRLDDRTEARIEKLINTLTSLQDSESSKTRITRLKTEAITGLEKSIRSYAAERRKIVERIRSNKNVPANDALSADLDKLDARIQKRADQIMELAKSMPQRQDVEKYEETEESYWDGWYFQTTQISEEYKQNRRQGIATEKELRELAKALEEAIGDLNRRRDTIKAKVDGGQLSEASKDLANQELGRIDAMIAHRTRELKTLSAPTEAPVGEEADKNAADHLRQRFDDARGDLAEDHWTVIKKIDEAIEERNTILKMKANLAAREEWLKEHGGE